MSLANAIMDLILMGLLLAALGFGVRLDKRLKALKAGQEAFAQAVRDLDDAAIRAHHSLKELRADADESQELLHGRVMAAREALNRLETQIARAERAQTDLDKVVERGVAAWETAASLRAAPLRPSTAAPVVASEPEATRPIPHPVRFDRRDGMAAARPSRLPEATAPDESEILDKVQMSELVVANLNEMIRTLGSPSSQAQARRMPQKSILSLEDDLFGDSRKR